MVPCIKSGSVWVWVWVWASFHTALDPALPFGGYKHSGLGQEMGSDVIEHYADVKSALMNI